jgi:stearoyl-CoA desaturase (delta-9 desaturase)
MQTDYNKIADFAKFPELVWLDRWFLLPWSAFAVLIFVFFGWEGFVWGFCVSNVLVWHITNLINSACHGSSGYRRFETSDQSRNLWLFGVVSLGDGFHNNHHYDPSSACHGFAWWEIDLTWYILNGLNGLGLVWDLKTPKQWKRNQSM